MLIILNKNISKIILIIPESNINLVTKMNWPKLKSNIIEDTKPIKKKGDNTCKDL
jgi:hypothetical protein